MNPAGPERSGVVWMILATLLWGATFVVLRDIVGAIDPAALIFVRFGLAGLLFLPIVLARPRTVTRAVLEGGIVSGLFTTGGYLFQAIGITSTSAGSSAFLTSAATIFAAFFAWPILRQRPQPVLVAGIGVALAGAALLSIRADFRIGSGDLWTLLGAACYAVQIVIVSIYAARVDSVALVAAQSLTVALVVLPFAGAAPAQVAALDPDGWVRLGYLIVAGSMLAPLFQVLAQRRLDPGRIGLLFALEPVFALAFALTFGGERFVARWWVGAALILVAVLFVEGAAARRARRPD
jgi:drug/metabolite transporter (DMT)-like permease